MKKLSVNIFQKEEESPPEDTNLMELKVRGTWEGAPIVNLAFESDYVANTGPYIKTRFAEQLWLKCDRLADDRFNRIQSEEEEPTGILVGMDQLNSIISRGASTQSPCGYVPTILHLERCWRPVSRDSISNGSTNNSNIYF